MPPNANPILYQCSQLTEALLSCQGRPTKGCPGRSCEYIGIDIGDAEVFKFANDNTFVRILENVRARDVFIVQPTAEPGERSHHGKC